MCVWNVWIDVKPLLHDLFSSWQFNLPLQGGNLMFAADYPTKRAALMTDMTLGCWSHVPALRTSFSQFFWNGNRLSPEPAYGFIWISSTSARLSQSEDCFISGYVDRHLSTSVQYSVLGLDGSWKPLGRASGARTSLFFIIIPRISSWWTTLNS